MSFTFDQRSGIAPAWKPDQMLRRGKKARRRLDLKRRIKQAEWQTRQAMAVRNGWVR